ncbi:MAG TPA: hypothetical protein VMR02_02730 [Terracidiphilus sp.]|jgi:hypothetical protein|nr:hypothetical protein [Terracidiphilus sp.]
MYDKFQLLAGTAEFPVGVVGNPAAFDYELVDLRGDTADWRDKTGRGAYWLGTIGTVNGTPRTELAEPLDTTATAYVGQLYAAHVTRGLEERRVADDAAWLENYYTRLLGPRRQRIEF